MDHLRKIIFSRKTTCKMADPVLYCYLVKKSNIAYQEWWRDRPYETRQPVRRSEKVPIPER